jgi:PAS domain S-box-containing protein
LGARMPMKYRFLTTCFVAGIGYWLLESSVHFYFFGSHGFELMPHDAHELWMRITIFLMFIAIGVVMEMYAKGLVMAALRSAELERRLQAAAAEREAFAAEYAALEQAHAAALQAAQKGLRQAVEGSPDGYWEASTHGTIVEVNEAYCRLSGYAREEIVGQPIASFDANEDREAVLDHLARIAAQGSDKFHTVHRAKDGRLWNAEVLVSNPKGGRIFAFIRDVTQQ